MKHLVWLLLLVGCASEEGGYLTPWEECVNSEYVRGLCANDPLVAVCISQYNYDKDICWAKQNVADWHYLWCLDNTPGSWLGKDCADFACLYRTEKTARYCL